MEHVIFSHYKSLNEQQLEKLAAGIIQVYPGECKLQASTQFAKEYRQVGSWDKWINQVVKENDTLVLTTLKIGKATMQVARAMMQQKKQVKLYNGRELKTVRFIKTLDASNWKQGWMAIYR